MAKNTKTSDPDFDDLMNEEDESDELSELEEQDEIEPETLVPQRNPKIMQKISNNAEKKTSSASKAPVIHAPIMQRPANLPNMQKKQSSIQINQPVQIPQEEEEPQVREETQNTANRRYRPVAQQALVGIVNDLGEPIVTGITLEIAQMWADLKNDIAELRQEIGKI